MTNDAITIIRLVFDTIWHIFTDWKIPGTNVSPASWFVFLIVASLAIRILIRVTSRSSTAGGSIGGILHEKGGSKK